MEFRPCIDIHNGKVKQIVGSSLRDAGNQAVENFVCEQDAAYFAKLYHKYHFRLPVNIMKLQKNRLLMHY